MTERARASVDGLRNEAGDVGGASEVLERVYFDIRCILRDVRFFFLYVDMKQFLMERARASADGLRNEGGAAEVFHIRPYLLLG